jgi:starvation-inducible outer membrane lipoprotein
MTDGIGFEMLNGMRWLGFIMILAMALAGCASQPTAVAPARQDRSYSPASAAALAFDPPVLAGTPRLDLSRDGRGPAAFAGFNDATTTYYSLETNDWYSDYAGGWGGRGANPNDYQRQAVSETFGISYH